MDANKTNINLYFLKYFSFQSKGGYKQNISITGHDICLIRTCYPMHDSLDIQKLNPPIIIEILR